MQNTLEHNPLRKAMNVLVIEDERRMRDLLLDTIPDMGFGVEAVRSAEEALVRMHTNPREILIVDLNLPQMGGLDFLCLIKQRWPRTRAIVLTAYGDLPSAQRAIQLEVVEFLTKPCPLGEIERALARARELRLAGAMGELAEEPLSSEQFTLDAAERNAIRVALARHGGNRKAAARELGISRRTLHYRLSRYRKAGEPVD
jgi:DNA-binding NtrC family response regulator